MKVILCALVSSLNAVQPCRPDVGIVRATGKLGGETNRFT